MLQVILAGHIAPGFRPSFEDDASFYPAFNLRFLKLLDDYKDIITACIFGHDHTDSFHLTYDKDSRLILSRLSLPGGAFCFCTVSSAACAACARRRMLPPPRVVVPIPCYPHKNACPIHLVFQILITSIIS